MTTLFKIILILGIAGLIAVPKEKGKYRRVRPETPFVRDSAQYIHVDSLNYVRNDSL